MASCRLTATRNLAVPDSFMLASFMVESSSRRRQVRINNFVTLTRSAERGHNVGLYLTQILLFIFVCLTDVVIEFETVRLEIEDVLLPEVVFASK